LAAFRAFQLGELAQILGLLYQKPERFLGITGGINDEGFQEAAAAVESLIEQRAQARRDSDFEAADAIRGTLESRGVVLEDLPDGTTSWRQT